jgi:hypothetical protein
VRSELTNVVIGLEADDLRYSVHAFVCTRCVRPAATFFKHLRIDAPRDRLDAEQLRAERRIEESRTGRMQSVSQLDELSNSLGPQYV